MLITMLGGHSLIGDNGQTLVEDSVLLKASPDAIKAMLKFHAQRVKEQAGEVFIDGFPCVCSQARIQDMLGEHRILITTYRGSGVTKVIDAETLYSVSKGVHR